MKSDTEESADFLNNWDDLLSKFLNNAIKPFSLNTEHFGKIYFWYTFATQSCITYS